MAIAAELLLANKGHLQTFGLLWGWFALVATLTCIILPVLPDSLAGKLPKPLLALQNKLLSYWKRARDLSSEGPFYRLVIWFGKKGMKGKLASKPRAPGLRFKGTSCEDGEVTLTPNLPWNPFHEENYIVACARNGKEEWAEKEYIKDFDFEKVGAKLRTHLDTLPERTSIQVRACAKNAHGRSEWSKVCVGETFARPTDAGGLTGPLAPSYSSAREYTWTQSRIEVWVKIPVGPEMKARDIRFKCSGPKLEVRWAEGDKLNDILVGPLYKKVKSDEVYWIIEDDDKKMGRHLSIQLMKADVLEKWPCLIEADGHTRIDVRLIRFFTGDLETVKDLQELGTFPRSEQPAPKKKK